jgi:hypothetical protein
MTAPGPQRHVLRANAITNLPDRRFAVIHLLPNPDRTAPVGARIFLVLGDSSSEFDVMLGETFPVGDETWRLDEVTMPEDRRFTATISRVG